jgi:predicted transcriptional regulator
MYARGMGTTTIRVDTDTHARLVELSESAGSSLMATVSDAAEALRRQRFAHQVAAELSDLRDDPEAWSGYLAESDATTVTDGVG